MASRFLLDTHVVVDIGTKGGFEAMPVRVQQILGNPEIELLVSVASEVEVAIKSRLRKLLLTKQEWDAVCNNASITFYPLRQQHTDLMFDLPLHHKDPFDRLIISTAISDDLPVISCDKEFRKYKGLQVIW